MTYSLLDSHMYGLRHSILGTWMGQGKAELVDNQFPKRRRTPVLCPFTGEETWSRYGISDRILDLLNLGLEKEQENRKESSRKTYWFNHGRFYVYPRIVIRLTGKRHRQTELDVGKLAEVLLGQQYKRVEHRYHTSIEAFLRLENEPEKSDHMYGLDLTDEQAVALRNFAEDLNDALQQLRQDEFDRGRDFLLGLANGSLTINDINRANGVES